MIHIVFQEADIEALKASFILDENLSGEVIQVRDDYAVGPIEGIFQEEGRNARKDWWRMVLAGGDYDGAIDKAGTEDHLLVEGLIKKLTDAPEETLWIWAAQNKHDVAGYYWLVSQLKEQQGRILILYLNNLPFINEKGNIFYPENIYQIQAKEFVKAKRLARLVTPAEFEIDTDEWLRLMNEGKGVRTLEGGKKLIEHEYDYFDNALTNFITPEWQRVNRLLHAFYNKSKITTGDAYLLWRIKILVKEGIIDAQGEIGKMKDFEVKRKEI